MRIRQAVFIVTRRCFLQKAYDILPAMNRPAPVLVVFLTVTGLSAFGQQSTLSTAVKSTPTGASATVVPPGAEVLAFERSMEAAVVRGDYSYVDSVSAPDLTFTHGDAWTTGGKPLLIDDRRTFLQRVQNKQYNVRDLDSVKVEMHGDIAITYGRYVAQNRTAKPEQSWFSVWFERVYEKRDGHWLYVSHRTVHGPTYGPDRQSVSGK
jgi:Domain of unknown function (DUF4440)